MRWKQLSFRAGSVAGQDVTIPETESVAKLGNIVRQEPFGSVVVLEGNRVQRLQLAQALASHLGYRINLGAVVSKYIGETEKNLDRLFAEANSAGSILFFDEADALFGSRTEVKDSHDRYAGLSGRLLSFQGLLIIGADSRHSVPIHRLPRCRVISVSEHWPPR